MLDRFSGLKIGGGEQLRKNLNINNQGTKKHRSTPSSRKLFYEVAL